MPAPLLRDKAPEETETAESEKGVEDVQFDAFRAEPVNCSFNNCCAEIEATNAVSIITGSSLFLLIVMVALLVGGNALRRKVPNRASAAS